MTDTEQNDDHDHDHEMFKRLFIHPEVKRVAAAILEQLDGQAPGMMIAGLTVALAETILTRSSPPQYWAAVIGAGLQTLVSRKEPVQSSEPFMFEIAEHGEDDGHGNIPLF